MGFWQSRSFGLKTDKKVIRKSVFTFKSDQKLWHFLCIIIDLRSEIKNSLTI